MYFIISLITVAAMTVFYMEKGFDIAAGWLIFALILMVLFHPPDKKGKNAPQ